MLAKLILGKPIAEKIKEILKKEIEILKIKTGKSPRLVALQLGDNAASGVYAKAQMNVAFSLGIDYVLKEEPADISQEKAEKVVAGLNKDDNVCGIILQMPVPGQIDAKKLLKLITPCKDAEGMHPENLGQVLLGDSKITPPAATACLELIVSTGADLYGKEAVIVGHSEIVGRPLSLMLLSKFATTTVCHIGTAHKGFLEAHVRRAEVLVVAVGKAELIKGDWVRPGAVVIDVGINKVADKITGDVEFLGARERASYITPVPGGVGPLTTTLLMRNVVELFKNRQ